MKKSLLLLIPLIMMSCKKEAAVTDMSDKDSLMANEGSIIQKNDSSNQANNDSLDSTSAEAQKVSKDDVMREEKDRVIIRMAEGKKLPFTIEEEFTEKHDKLILKITNFTKPKITAKITTEQQDFNIRFNQIKLPDGKMNGPFMREIIYDIPKSGEVWLIVGKNNMADGKTTGKFSVRIE